MIFNIRKIEVQDYYKDYFNLLSQLTYAENVNFEEWKIRIKDIEQNPYHHIFVIEDKDKIIASITVLIEMKIIRNLSYISHIEDIIVSSEYRNMGLAKKLIEYCIELSKNYNCYKIILNCEKNLIPFYSKFGFCNKNIEMSIYL